MRRRGNPAWPHPNAVSARARRIQRLTRGKLAARDVLPGIPGTDPLRSRQLPRRLPRQPLPGRDQQRDLRRQWAPASAVRRRSRYHQAASRLLHHRPGRLTKNKPDVAGYTHFKGSGVYTADGGTSAATPVVAGVVAAVRSARPYNPADSTTSPAAIRSLVPSGS
jgi:subtilisin family serine protease